MQVVCDLYARVSTSEQAQEGYSLGEQEDRLRAYAKAQGWIVHACHIDPGFSGAKLERPGIQAVIADAKAHKIQRVVTYKLDRLSRSQKDTLHLIEDVFLTNGVDYVSMTESFDTGTPFGRAMIGILSVFAQLEREQIKERMAMGRLATVKDGNWRGGCGVSLGYRYQIKNGKDEGRLIVDEYEAAAVRRVYDLFLEGHNYSDVLRHLLTEYPMPGRSTKHSATYIKNILQNRIYIGDILFQGEYYPGNHEHIISDDVFWSVQKKMAEYQDALSAQRRAPQYRGHLLTGFTYCGCCGSRVHRRAHHHNNKDGTVSHYGFYVCFAKVNGKCHDSKQWKEADLEEAVLSQVERLRFDEMKVAKDTTASELLTVEKEMGAIDRQQEKLVQLFTLGSIPIEAIQKQSAVLVEERQKLETRRDIIRASNETAVLDKFRDAVSRVSEIRNMDLADKRDILRVLIDSITIYPDRTVEIKWTV